LNERLTTILVLSATPVRCPQMRSPKGCILLALMMGSQEEDDE
jgi:hypothetical protein